MLKHISIPSKKIISLTENMWEIVFRITQAKRYEMIMFAIGSSMERYETIDDNNNQQYPKFLRPFDHVKKLIVLIDPELESPIKLTNYQALTVTPNAELSAENCTFYQGQFNDVLAINKEFDYDTSLIFDLVEYCMQTNIKLIWQDYTGRITTDVFINLSQIIGKDVAKYVLFDASEKDDGCFVDFSNIVLKIDPDGFFVQPRYYPLVQVTKTPNFNMYFRERITVLRYPLLWNYKSDEKVISSTSDGIKLQILYLIYGRSSLPDLIENIMRDICGALGIDYHTSIYSHYFHNIRTDPSVYNECSKQLRVLYDSLSV